MVRREGKEGGMKGFLCVVAAVLFLGATTYALVWKQQSACYGRFADSNLEAKWGWPEGCRVRVPGHGWLPADNYRVLP